MYLLKSSHNLGNTDERAQGSELRSPAGEESGAGIRDLFSRLPPCRVLLSWPGPPSKPQLLAGIPCIYYPYQGVVPVPSLLLEVPECLGRLTLYLCLFLKVLKTHTFENSVQFSSVTLLCLTLCDPVDCSTPGLPVHHQLPELTQTHVH